MISVRARILACLYLMIGNKTVFDAEVLDSAV